MTSDRSYGRAALIAARPLCMVVFVFALAAVTVVDVDGDPTTSNVPSVMLTDGIAVNAEAIEVVGARRQAKTLKSHFRLSPRQIANHLPIVRVLWASGKRLIRGP